MITELSLNGYGCFAYHAKAMDLKRINFIYGRNGVGKSSFVKALKKRAQDQKISLHIFDTDFLKRNLLIEDKLNGILLGKKDVDIQKQIQSIRDQEALFQEKSASAEEKWKEQLAEENKKRTKYQTKIFEVGKKYFQTFPDEISMPEINRHSRSEFAKSLEKLTIPIKYESTSFNELLQRKKEIESTGKKEVSSLPEIDINSENFSNADAVLKQSISVQASNAFLVYIKNNGSANWVSQGKKYIKDDCCPFCQHDLTKSEIRRLQNNIAGLFDLSYNTKKEEIVKQQSSIESLKTQLSEYFSNLLAGEDSSSYFVAADVETTASSFQNYLDTISDKLGDKLKHMTKPDTIGAIIKNIEELVKHWNNLIKTKNEEIDTNNQIVKNFTDTKAQFKWQVLKSLEGECLSFKDDYDDGLSEIKKNEKNKKALYDSVENEIKALKSQEKELINQSSNYDIAADSINNVLRELDFGAIQLRAIDRPNERSYYAIDRANIKNIDVNTLSEGELRCLGFLYFCEQITDIPIGERLLIFDDPVSSLDRQSQYLITAIIQNLYVQMTSRGQGQMFVLSHNVPFFKQISLNRSGNSYGFGEIIKINNNASYHVRKSGFISTGYESLWSELIIMQTAGETIGLRNTMRRILETFVDFNYRISITNIDESFSDLSFEDRNIIKSLVIWMHTGSHAFDPFDEDNQDAPESIATYMRLFKKIFEKMNALDHYDAEIKAAKAHCQI